MIDWCDYSGDYRLLWFGTSCRFCSQFLDDFHLLKKYKSLKTVIESHISETSDAFYELTRLVLTCGLIGIGIWVVIKLMVRSGKKDRRKQLESIVSSGVQCERR